MNSKEEANQESQVDEGNSSVEFPRFKPLSGLLQNNREIVSAITKKAPSYFTELSREHKPKYLMIGCSDARIQPNTLLGIKPGELFIHRNIANQVYQGDLNANAVIQYAIEGLGINEVIVMGHSNCGGIKAIIDDSLKDGKMEIVSQWLSSIKETYEVFDPAFSRIPDRLAQAKALAKANVRHQCMNLIRSGVIRKARAAGRNVQVHGWYMDVSTGIIDELRFNDQYTKNLHHMYGDLLLKLAAFDSDEVKPSEAEPEVVEVKQSNSPSKPLEKLQQDSLSCLDVEQNTSQKNLSSEGVPYASLSRFHAD